MKIYCLTTSGLTDAFNNGFENDLKLTKISLLVVCLYMILFLGGWSPIHCRLVIAIVGIVSVTIACIIGFAICFYFDQKMTKLHYLIPLLLLGIGIKNIFVLCNALDQTNLQTNTDERIKEVLRHVGPSFTIAWLVNALFFLCGSTMSQTGLKSFCIFSFSSVTTLYMCLLTFFLCALVWDTRRVAYRANDCCTICSHC